MPDREVVKPLANGRPKRLSRRAAEELLKTETDPARRQQLVIIIKNRLNDEAYDADTALMKGALDRLFPHPTSEDLAEEALIKSKYLISRAKDLIKNADGQMSSLKWFPFSREYMRGSAQYRHRKSRLKVMCVIDVLDSAHKKCLEAMNTTAESEARILQRLLSNAADEDFDGPNDGAYSVPLGDEIIYTENIDIELKESIEAVQKKIRETLDSLYNYVQARQNLTYIPAGGNIILSSRYTSARQHAVQLPVIEHSPPFAALNARRS